MDAGPFLVASRNWTTAERMPRLTPLGTLKGSTPESYDLNLN
jgi:hypothetical protein